MGRHKKASQELLSLIPSADVPDDQVIDSIFSERRTHHADDAVDYEDIDELADDDDLDLHLAPAADFDPESNDAAAAAAADDEFDAMFGEVPDLEHPDFPDKQDVFAEDDLFSGLANSAENDGLDDLNMDQIFDVPSHDVHQSRHALAPEALAAKRARLYAKIKRLEAKRAHRNISRYFPSYSRMKPYNFHKFFVGLPKYYKFMRPPLATRLMIKPLIPSKVKLEVDTDLTKVFRAPSTEIAPLANYGPGRIVHVTDQDRLHLARLDAKAAETAPPVRENEFLKRDWLNNDRFGDYLKDLILSNTDWDDDAIINAGETRICPPKPINTHPALDYDDDSIFEGIANSKPVHLDMNDPHLLFVPQPPRSLALRAQCPVNAQMVAKKFNFSNDDQYSALKQNYHTKVRSQLSNLNIEHSLPALKLQGPFYKVKLLPSEARSLHRPRYLVRPGTLVSFSRLKVRKKKRDRNKTFQEIFSKTTDLTCADSCPLMGMEFAEEYPPILLGYGMGSKIINYYRKERQGDLLRPKAPIGETHVLGVEDRSPFWNFGEVAPGDFVPTLYNNMIRAPIFKHDMRQTDFLMVRSHGAGAATRHYLRPINFMFTAGNTFPAGEVPAPHSRKVTNIFKNRLKMVVYRVMNKNGNARVLVRDISRHFPDQNDMQNRQRLKEFMEYQRHGDDHGFWKLKNMDTVPMEAEVRQMITPEDAALIDSMQHGQQILDDITILFKDGVKKSSRERKLAEEDEAARDEKSVSSKEPSKDEKSKSSRDDTTEIDIDEEMTPWTLSRNFMQANLSKMMLQLNGEGDPSGIGLGYSMLRATQRNPFCPLFAPTKSNTPKNNSAAHQQRLYEAEIKRIWYSQRSSLVDHGPGEDFNVDAVYDEYPPLNHMLYIKKKVREQRAKAPPPILRISRRVRDQHGVVQRRVETITDPCVIRAYIHRKKQIEDELLKNAEVGDILPTSDKELNKIRRRALEEKLANLEKRAKHSKAKKPVPDGIQAAAAAGGTIIDANTVMLPNGLYAIGGRGIGKGKSKTRRCAACGAFGHIRTRKTCPLYNQTLAAGIITEDDGGGTGLLSVSPGDVLPGDVPMD